MYLSRTYTSAPLDEQRREAGIHEVGAEAFGHGENDQHPADHRDRLRKHPPNVFGADVSMDRRAGSPARRWR